MSHPGRRRPSGVVGHRIVALTALAPVTWGATYLVTTQFLPPDRPLLSGAIRALPMGLVALAITRTLPRGAWWWRAAVLGTLNIGAFVALLFVAAYRLPGVVAAPEPVADAGPARVRVGCIAATAGGSDRAA